jgi:hypothetical protein
MHRALLSIRRPALLAAAVAAAALAAPAVASANPACGSTVTHNVTLHSDMTCLSSDGLDVGKSGVTINLNGHTITGTSSYDGINNYHHNNVTVENGTVRDFDYGVLYEYTAGSRILHVKALNIAYDGIGFWYSTNGLIDRSTATGGSYGLYLYQNYKVNVTNSKAHNNTYGVYDYYSHATLDNVTANSNQYGFYIDYPLATGTSKKPAYYLIRNSTANNNSYAGFYIYDNYGREYLADLIGNTANNNSSYGFYAEYRTKGSHNHAHGNGTNFYRVPGS